MYSLLIFVLLFPTPFAPPMLFITTSQITHFSTFCSKVFLTLKIMDFENVPLTKVVHIYVIEGMNV
jgi:hypothetical protein